VIPLHASEPAAHDAERMVGFRSALLAAPLMLVFCNENKAENKASAPSASAPASAAPSAPAPASAAKDIARVRCAMCHGESGQGNGPSAATLNPKPRDWTNKEWQKSTSDADIRSVIVGGGGSVGKSLLMPPNPDLKDKPAVVDELVKIVRGYGGK